MAASQWNLSTDMPDLNGKVAVVTGGSFSSGIGLETVRFLARKGAKVYLTTRSEARARQAKDRLTKDTGIDTGNVECLVMDLYDLVSITHAVEELKRKETKLHILINNAAASTSSTMLVDGKYEQHMVANHMGPFILVNRLLPLLTAATKDSNAHVRIVNLSSTAMTSMLPASFKFSFDSPTCFKDPVPSHPWQWRYLGRFMFGFDMIRYAVSKAAVILFTRELQERLHGQSLPITCIAVHPGEALTEGVLAINNILVRAIARASFLTAEQGAVNSLFAATAIEVKSDTLKYKGRFIVPVGKVEEPNPVARDDRQVKGLWENTMVECDEKLPSCFNCARRGMTCSLTPSQPSPQNIEPVGRVEIDNTETNPSPDALSVAVLWSAPMPGASLDFQDHSLELMHHYSTITANTLALRLDMQHIWRMVLPEMSYNAPFFSHSLLSIAALHKVHLLPARRDKYLDLAAYHQTRGMEGFRSIFHNIDERNWHPAFCFSSTIIIYAFSPAGRTEDAMADVLQIFVLIRGVRSSLVGAGRNLMETPFSALANGIGQNDEVSYDYDPPLDHSALPLDIFQALRRLLAFYRTNLSDCNREDYEFASLQLRRSAILIAHAGNQADISMVMFFPYVISAGVMSDIQANDPCALVLLSYFSVLLSLVEQQFWYIQGWSRRLVEAVDLQLDGNTKFSKVA
ncbi:sterol uptake control 2 [Fusarium circinatum]|uniref:Sterol uptake control 2 n=1 Tax=Fusarium circinatum TaxID=48490 RepID=A0A8H5TXH2_FUSCI|nr:sterol uptake control 2 [Fusarium circinatum]